MRNFILNILVVLNSDKIVLDSCERVLCFSHTL